MEGVDAVIAASTPGPGIIKKEWVTKMAKNAIVFACANPIPEIWPWEAEEAGAVVTATGRSDFKNQVNNSLGFPAVFRGALDVSAKTITDEMCVAGAYAVAKYAEDKTISEDYIIPTMSETQMFIEEAVAVGMKAIEQGVARKKISKKELEENLKKQRQREVENYEYQKQLERKRAQDKYDEDVRLLEKKNKEKQESLEKSWQLREAHSRVLVAASAYDHQVRQMDGRLFGENSPLDIFLRIRPGMLLDEVDPLNDRAAGRREDTQHLPRFPAVFPRQHENHIVLLDMHSSHGSQSSLDHR
jgi:hypothetical protein